MIVQLTGTFDGWVDDLFVVNCGGVGYGVFGCDVGFEEWVPSEEVTCCIYEVYRENKAPALYGFTSELGRIWFGNLLKVAGIGPDRAARLLISHGYPLLIEMIRDGNVDELVIPKIRKDLAQKIVKRLQKEALK